MSFSNTGIQSKRGKPIPFRFGKRSLTEIASEAAGSKSSNEEEEEEEEWTHGSDGINKRALPFRSVSRWEELVNGPVWLIVRCSFNIEMVGGMEEERKRQTGTIYALNDGRERQ